MTQLNDSATPVRAEESELKKLKDVLGTQGTLRPIFEGQLRQRRSVRERALALRKLVAESGLDYKAVSEICGADDSQPEPDLKPVLKSKLTSEATEADIDELIELFVGHFRPAQRIPAPPLTNGTHEKGEEAKIEEN